jgi:hypothetical protein
MWPPHEDPGDAMVLCEQYAAHEEPAGMTRPVRIGNCDVHLVREVEIDLRQVHTAAQDVHLDTVERRPNTDHEVIE